MARLDDLPNEIILHIFDRPKADISTQGLFHLSRTSRRLYTLCLPLFLARYGINEPEKLCEVILKGPEQTPKSIDALSGLMIARYIPYVDNLICRFLVPGDVEDYIYVGKHIRRLHYFISSLSSVKNVMLQFGNKRCGCCAELDPGQTLNKELKTWSNAMASILNLLLEKGCEEMVLTGGKFMTHTYVLKTDRKFRTPGLETGALPAIKRWMREGSFTGLGLVRSPNWVNVLEGDNWRFRRDRETGNTIVLTSLATTARQKSVLRSLTISSMMFGTPPLLHWMICVLRLPTMQSLTLKNFPLTHKAWLVVLTLISEHCSHLTELQFSRLRQLNASDLLYFLGQFPNLSSLHLAHSVELSGQDEEDIVPFPTFPNLKTLHAPAPWLCKLLKKQPHALPALETISIFCSYEMGLLDWLMRSSDTSLPVLLENVPLLSSIHLKVSLGQSPGFRMSSESQVLRGAEPELFVKVDHLSISVDCEKRVGDIELIRVLPKWTARFDPVRHLSVKILPQAMGEVEATFLIRRIIRDGRPSSLVSFDGNGTMMNFTT